VIFTHALAETVIAYLATLLARHVVILLPAHITPDCKLAAIRAYAAEYVLDTPPRTHELVDGLEALGTRTRSVRVGELNLLRTGFGGDPPSKDVEVLLPTSGTTGDPTTVQLPGEGLWLHAQAVANSLSLDGTDRAALALPICYSYGLSIVNSHLIAGGSLVVVPAPPASRQALSLVAAHGCTSFSAVAPTYQEIVRRDRLSLLAAGRMRALTQAGGPLDCATTLKLHNTISGVGGRLFVMYGQTEAAGRITCLEPEFLPEKLGSVGQPIGGVAVSIGDDIVRDGGSSTVSHDIGEIIVRSPGQMLGYAATRTEIVTAVPTTGPLHTGDVGRLDPDGFLYVHGRWSRYIKLGSYRISLDEIERVCAPRPVAAIGPDDLDDRVTVFTTVSHREEIGGIRSSLDFQLPRWGIARTAVCVESIAFFPRLPTGKIDYRSLRAQRRCSHGSRTL
jgi:acyl-CoA synthetase (AMP-forming)/AMP-acid ligase II